MIIRGRANKADHEKLCDLIICCSDISSVQFPMCVTVFERGHKEGFVALGDGVRKCKEQQPMVNPSQAPRFGLNIAGSCLCSVSFSLQGLTLLNLLGVNVIFLFTFIL